MPPQVSVVVSAYQKAEFLPRALQSVLDQTFEDFEVIVVDDGSTDNTRDIVDEFVKRDSRVHYVYQENQGPGGARNTGIHHAKADLIALLDGDDTWNPGKLEHQVGIMNKYPQIDLLFTNSEYINDVDPNRVVKKDDFYHDYVIRTFDHTRIVPHLLLLTDTQLSRKLFHKNVIILSTVIFQKQLFVQTGGFALDLRGPEDTDFWVRAALKDHQFAYSDVKSVTYFKNYSSLVLQNEVTKLEQLKYAQYAHQSEVYVSLKMAALRKVHERYRELILLYASKWQLLKVWRAFGQSLSYGLSIRTLVFALASTMGPFLFRFYRSVKQQYLQHGA